MNAIKICIAVFASLAAGISAPSLAGSSAASASADSSATSVGSVSGSIRRSSESSVKATVAQGDYQVIEVAAAAGQPGTMRLTLQAVADRSGAGELLLYVPTQAIERGGVVAGQRVTARQRPYGIEFASAGTQQAFFLALADDWWHELQSVPVS